MSSRPFRKIPIDGKLPALSHLGCFEHDKQGLFYRLEAGDNGADAKKYSPTRVNHANVYTISAIDSLDVFAYFSNWGNPPVDYAAPGVYVLSTKKGGGTTTFSGTSMATPHVAGLLLLGSIKSD